MIQHICPDCRWRFPTERELDDHILAARHWDDPEDTRDEVPYPDGLEKDYYSQ